MPVARVGSGAGRPGSIRRERLARPRAAWLYRGRLRVPSAPGRTGQTLVLRLVQSPGPPRRQPGRVRHQLRAQTEPRPRRRHSLPGALATRSYRSSPGGRSRPTPLEALRSRWTPCVRGRASRGVSRTSARTPDRTRSGESPRLAGPRTGGTTSTSSQSPWDSGPEGAHAHQYLDARTHHYPCSA